MSLLKLLMGDYLKKFLVTSTSGAEQMNEYMLKSFAMKAKRSINSSINSVWEAGFLHAVPGHYKQLGETINIKEH